MIKKIIFIALMLTTVSYASVDNTINKQSISPSKEEKAYQALPSDITSNVSGKSCDDGNCFKGSKCLTKDGPMPQCIAKISKNVKRFCAKL